jgi:outer membrane protein assembly factor BamA
MLDEVLYRYYHAEDDDYLRHRERETGVYFLTRYPLNKFLRLDFENQIYNWESHWDTWVWHTADVDGYWINDTFLGVEEKAKKDFIYAPALTLVHDNSLYGPTGPLLGWKGFLTMRKSFALNKNDYQTAYMDLRSYTLFSKRYSLALRLVGGASGGKQPQTFSLDGYYGIRGYEEETTGEKIAMVTAELRFPFMDYIAIAFPLPLVLGSIRGSIFADAGSVWDKNDEFRGMQDNLLKDIKLGFGYGPRMNIGIAVLKLDFAWLTDLKSISKPTFYLSLTEDF